MSLLHRNLMVMGVTCSVMAPFFNAHDALAESEKKIVEACFDLAVERLQEKLPDCEINSQNVTAVAIDSRWYNPSKYVWYQNTNDCSDSGVDSPDYETVLIQYYRGRCY